MTDIVRREALKSGMVLAAAAAGTSGVSSAAANAYYSVTEETQTLDALYAQAKLEGGGLVVYAGGDTPTQQDRIKQAFLAQFPDIKLKMVVDYSKYHDGRIDHQIATNTLVADVVQLQTVHDFPRWKAEGKLLPYKPAGFSAVYPRFKDPDGAWVATNVVAFSFMHDAALGASGPQTARDLADPRWKGLIASSYPHDDDAVLFLYKLYTEAYGLEWLQRFAAQTPQFNRGTHNSIGAVASKAKQIGVGGAGSLLAQLAPGVQWVVPATDPFMAWAQRAAIIKGAKHPAAAKLYLNWSLSQAAQQNAFNGWSVRTDVRPAGGLKPIWEFPNAFVDGFPKFMADRAQVERWKQLFALYFGEVQGAPTPGWLGMTPGAA